MQAHCANILPVILLFLSFPLFGQTFVSGNIHTNTTWTKSASPYIVTGDVVVSAGITLTIEAGVMVKFDDSTKLQLNQASLIAIGTAADSIIFTSNSVNPAPGKWNGINIVFGTMPVQLAYCNISYAVWAFNSSPDIQDSLIVKHSTFTNNFDGLGIYSLSRSYTLVDSCGFFDNSSNGIWTQLDDSAELVISNSSFLRNNNGIGCPNARGAIPTKVINCMFKYNGIAMSAVNNFRILNCIISNNVNGVECYLTTIKDCVIDSNNSVTGGRGIIAYGNDSIINCEITHNGDGISVERNPGFTVIMNNRIEYNNIGVYLLQMAQVTCNKICNNSLYNLGYYPFPFPTPDPLAAAGNYWCATDSAAIQQLIGFDGTNGAPVLFMPLDTQQCYLTGCNLALSINGDHSPILNATVTYSAAYNADYNYTWSVVSGTILSGQGTNTIEVRWNAAGAGEVELTTRYRVCENTILVPVQVSLPTNCSVDFTLYPDSATLHHYYAVTNISGTAPLTYLWNWGDGGTDTIPFPTHLYAAAGNYTICLSIMDSTGCTDDTCITYQLMKTGGEVISVNVVSALPTHLSETSFADMELFPNPTADAITLKAAGVHGSIDLQLFDMLGKLWLQKSITNETVKQGFMLKMDNCSDGIYFLRVRVGNNQQVIKVVKRS